MAADCTPGLVGASGSHPPAPWLAPADRSRYLPDMRTFSLTPRGPFDLATARDFAGGFPAGIGASAIADGAILMTFPTEDWASTVAVQLRQDADGTLHGEVFGDGDLEVVSRQAARSLSVDHD